jgi:hypothetical protein
MLILQVDINGWKSVELYDNEPVNLNYKFTEVTEVNKPSSSYSQTFRIPMTKANQDVFGVVGLGHIPSINYKQKIPARISRGGITLMEGFGQVKTFYIQRGSYQDLEFVVFGELANLSRSVGDAMLQDLNLSSYNFVMNSTNVSDGLSASGVLGGRIRLGVVDRFGFGNLNPYNGSINFTPADFTPFVQVSWILEEIFDAAGLTFESDFFDSASIDDLYLMALSGEQLYTIAQAQTQAVSVGQDSEQTINSSTWTDLILIETSPYYDDINAWSVDTFTAPVTGYYRFQFSAGHTATIDVNLRVVGSVGGTMYTNDLYEGEATEHIIDLYLQASEDVTFAVYAATASSFDILADLVLLQYVQTEGFTLDLARNLPEMKQIDFIAGLQKSFNLVLIADKNRPTHFYIEPWSDYMDSGTKKDWTNKINLDNDVTISPTTDLQKRRYIWRGAESEDQINSQAKSATGEIYGAKIIEDGSNDFASGEFVVDSPFAPFVVAPIGSTNVATLQLYKADSGIAKAIAKPKPFLAFYNGFAGGAIYYTIGGAQGAKPLPYYSANEKYVATLDNLSLHYGHPAPYHFIFTTPLNALYYRWWSRWANELYSPDARILEAMFYLTPSDIAQMEWSDKIYLFNQYWRILEIQNYDASQDGLTRVKLVKILGAISDCEQLPSTGSRGIIQGSPTSLSKKCCERYGFVYDLTSKKCYQPTPLQV